MANINLKRWGAQIMNAASAKKPPDTEAHKINFEEKRAAETKAYLTEVAKKVNKYVKYTAQLREYGPTMSQTLVEFSQSLQRYDPNSKLSMCLEQMAEIEEYTRYLYGAFETTLKTMVSGPMVDFTKDQIPKAQATKKRHDQARRNYDLAIFKVASVIGGKKQKDEKVKEAEDEMEKQKEIYLAKGEEAWNDLLDVNEMNEFEQLEKMCCFFESYYQFYKGGWGRVNELHKKFVDYRRHIAQERTAFEEKKQKREKGAWIPEFVAGGGHPAHESEKNSTQVFGVNYNELCKRLNEPIPALISQSIDYLVNTEQFIKQQGIFRVSAPKPKLDAIRSKANKGDTVDIASLDVHTVTGLIKAFLRDLPAPLLTYELYTDFVGLSELEKPERMKKLKSILGKLPKENYELFRKLAAMCVRIVEYSEDNKMNATNVAVVLCPSLLYEKDPNPMTMVKNISKANAIMVDMITGFEEIFGEGISIDMLQYGGHGIPKAWLGASTDLNVTKRKARRGHFMSRDRAAEDDKLSVSPMARPTAAKTLPPSPNAMPPRIPKRSPGAKSTFKSSPSFGDVLHTKDSLPIIQQRKESRPLPRRPAPKTEAPPNLDISSLPSAPYNTQISQYDNSLRGVDSSPTESEYFQLRDLTSSVCQFSRAASAKQFASQELKDLNKGLKSVAQSIRTMLNFIKTYATKFPNSIRQVILVSAKGMQEHIRGLIIAVKCLNEGSEVGSGPLLDATKRFSIAAVKFFVTCKAVSKQHEIGKASQDLVSIMNAPDQVSPELLHYACAKLATLFESTLECKLPKPLNDVLVGLKASTISLVGFFENTKDHAVLKTKTADTQEINRQIFALLERIIVFSSEANSTQAWRSTEAKFFELKKLSDQKVDNRYIKDALDKSSLLLGLMQGMKNYKDKLTSNAFEWMTGALSIVETLDGIILSLNDFSATKSEDSPVRVMLDNALSTLLHFMMQLELSSATTVHSITLEDKENIPFINVLRDTAFILKYTFVLVGVE